MEMGIACLNVNKLHGLDQCGAERFGRLMFVTIRKCVPLQIASFAYR